MLPLSIFSEPRRSECGTRRPWSEAFLFAQLCFNSLTFNWRTICLTTLCWFLWHISTNQPWLHIRPLPPEPPSPPTPQPAPRGITERWAELPASDSNLPLAVCVTQGDACFHSTLAAAPLTLPTTSVSLLSLSPSPSSLVVEWCSVLWDPRDSSPPGFSVHGILQARILPEVGLPFPSPGDLPDAGIEPRSPALRADS